ncbi:uncharacterized protein LOC142228142 isoform X2 [Haematobia irritans]|uniref:uncharacterized protein LOC142228142 isoform X2 n=1 Tax=Haematobia irritans TaxID=7368 RepID=UPI003F5038A6
MNMITGIAMLYTNFVSSIMLLTVLLAIVNSAPTHHLTIGVDGNTPTLIVTSSELGIVPDIERSHVKVAKPRKEYKTHEKLKSLKTKTSVNYKKDKSFYLSKTSNVATTPIPSSTEASSTKVISTYMTTSNVDFTPSVTDASFNSTSDTMPAQISTSVMDNVSSSSTQQPTEQTTMGYSSVRNSMEQTTEKEILSSATSVAVETSFKISTERTLTESETTEVTTLTAPTTAAWTGENIEIFNTSESVATKNPEITLDYSSPQRYQDVTMGTSIGTLETETPLTSSSTRSTTQVISESAGRDIATDPTITTEIGINQRPSPSSVTTEGESETTTTSEAVLKLIDLEKSGSEHFEDLSRTLVDHDNGHDGLKVIKKKQLIDKHYLEAIPHAIPQLESKAKTEVEHKHGYLGPILMAERTIHISDDANETSNKTEHSPEVESKLRESNFVELKASQPADSLATPTVHYLLESGENRETSVRHDDVENGPSTVLSTTVFQVAEGTATKVPSKAANTLFTSTDEDEQQIHDAVDGKMESKISDIQIEVYDSTIDSIVASTNFKDADISQGRSTKPPLPVAQQERFTQYVIDRTETSTQESINFSTIQVASGKPEPAAIEIHINVSESLGNDGEDVDVSFPLAEYNNNVRSDDTSYDEPKVNDDIKLKIQSNGLANMPNKDKSDEVLVVEIVDNVDNSTESRSKSRNTDELFITDVKETYATPPPPPPPPPFQPNFDRDSDTIFYISNTEVKVGETLPESKKEAEERKTKLENQFFPVNYMASTRPNVNNANGAKPNADHHIYEEDIILSSNRNQQDSLKIYRNRNEPSPPLDVTYVGESIIEVEQQSSDSVGSTSSPADHVVTPQPDVIIQPAILPEISIGVPVIGELPPQIELKEMDFLPGESQQHRPGGVYGDDGNGSINTNAIGGGSNDVDNRLDESSIQYGGDLIDESADGGFDGVEGSYPFGNPATMAKRKHENHMGDYAHLYVNYGVNNMRKDELTVDVKDSGEVAMILDHSSSGNEHNATLKDLLNRNTFNMSAGQNESERISNVTAFSIMEDSMDEKNTEDIINLISLAIGLFIVILPVVVTCSMLWALRYLYKKYHSNSTDNNGNLDTANGGKGQPHEDAAEKGEDMSRVARETKMDYNKDGVFVVEVARGIDSKAIPDSPVTEGSEKMLSMFEPKHNGTMGYKMTNEKISHNNEKVQIHSPPPDDGPRSLQQIEEVDEPVHSPRLHDNVDEEGIVQNYKSNVGLSQSDLSTSSSNDSNKDYCYGNQELYVVEQSGYSTSTPTGNVSLKCDSKDIKDDDSNSHNGRNLELTPEKKEGTKEAEDIVDTMSKETGTEDNVAEKITANDEQSDKEVPKEHCTSVQNDKKKGDESPDEIKESENLKAYHRESKKPENEAIIPNSDVSNTSINATKEISEDIMENKEGKVECEIDRNTGHQIDENESIELDEPIQAAHRDEVNSLEFEKEEHKNTDDITATELEEPIQAEHKDEVNSLELKNEEHKNIDDIPTESKQDPIPNGLDIIELVTDQRESNDETQVLVCNGNGSESLVEMSTKESISEVLETQQEMEGPSESNGIHNGLTNGHDKDSVMDESKYPDVSNHCNGIIEGTLDKPSHLTNGSELLPDLVPEEIKTHRSNGVDHANGDDTNNCMSELENGYDSIISLPEPPPTNTDEMLCNDLSELQLDSLPPPPPPLTNEFNGDVFNLKDLPPPLTTNGSEELPNEDAANIYASLPPPTPTALHVSSRP